MAKPKKIGGPKQKLSPKAAAKKKARDDKYNKEAWRKYAKRTAQLRKCRKGQDYDHRTKECVKSSKNRAGGRGGTKNEKTRRRYGY